MSADHGYTLNRTALIAEASQVAACGVFRVEPGGSRHVCADCGATLVAHIVVALRPKKAPPTSDPSGGVRRP